MNKLPSMDIQKTSKWINTIKYTNTNKKINKKINKNTNKRMKTNIKSVTEHSNTYIKIKNKQTNIT